MRNASYQHARSRRNSVVRARKRYKLLRSIGILKDGEQFNMSFSKHSIACKCKMCSLDREEGRKAKRRRENAVLDIRERDYEIEHDALARDDAIQILLA